MFEMGHFCWDSSRLYISELCQVYGYRSADIIFCAWLATHGWPFYSHLHSIRCAILPFGAAEIKHKKNWSISSHRGLLPWTTYVQQDIVQDRQHQVLRYVGHSIVTYSVYIIIIIVICFSYSIHILHHNFPDTFYSLLSHCG